MPRHRKITGFFALLTAEQLAAAMAYTGPDLHGDPALLTNVSAPADHAAQVVGEGSRDDPLPSTNRAESGEP